VNHAPLAFRVYHEAFRTPGIIPSSDS
jgi:hypothetical protein